MTFERSRQKKQPMQRPCDRNIPGLKVDVSASDSRGPKCVSRGSIVFKGGLMSGKLEA